MLHDFMFGSTKPITTEEHINIFQSTGWDIDGRLEHIEHMMPLIDNSNRRNIAFIKALPGFQSLLMDDIISLIKSKCHYF